MTGAVSISKIPVQRDTLIAIYNQQPQLLLAIILTTNKASIYAIVILNRRFLFPLSGGRRKQVGRESK
jgi:hypothetical protein